MKLLPRFIFLSVVSVAFLVVLYDRQFRLDESYTKVIQLQQKQSSLSQQLDREKSDFSVLEASFSALQDEDQVKTNRSLTSEIKNIHQSYSSLVTTYERLVKLRGLTPKTATLDASLAKALTLLSDKKYSEAQILITQLDADISKQNQQLAAAVTIPANVKESNTPPSSGYSRQKVNVNGARLFGRYYFRRSQNHQSSC